MAKRNGNGANADRKKNGGRNGGNGKTDGEGLRLHPETKKSIWGIVFVCVAVLLVLARFEEAGPAGATIYQGLYALFGWGYFILPVTLLFASLVFFLSRETKILMTTLLGGGLLILSFLGLIHVFSPGSGGWLGFALGSLSYPFGRIAAGIIDGFVLIISILITANVPLKLTWPEKKTSQEDEDDKEPLVVTGAEGKAAKQDKELGDKEEDDEDAGEIKAVSVASAKPAPDAGKMKKIKMPVFTNYVPPPLSLLKAEIGKPTTGDLLANANIIKRTLESFGIAVEMGEINVGPAVTRYTLKPAEGVKLSRITALNSDLALSLAAHPIRIEAPIPGKSLVGIEVPNKAAALVRLGSLMNYPDFNASGPLGFVLGRDVSGEPVFTNIEKMPHMLVAGATGSGKSILVHSLLISLLYKNSPQTLKLVLIDPKRVELSIYEGIPHLVSPVITENKKAVGVFKWAISEMERRYELLQKAGSRDIKSYNAAHKGPDELLPYILLVIDEMADLMTSYGRDVEGSIVRLAQMARATGIHLLLATQRPSVEVITGLIKANVTARIALQVASQIDSRTILDTAGAEKLLGHGDLLFLSAELSKPKRIQGAYITEEEIKNVANFIRDNNKVEMEEVAFDAAGANGNSAGGVSIPQNLDSFGESDDDSDELFDEALAIVKEAQKASASLLQRRLKVGYARAARLLDLMEAGGFIGPGDGAKPRDVNIERIESRIL
ncbi:MAG TPA: DNA translocase FtsK [Candidatus Paceibacterota bacterium]|jgi:S-DNA-T family DNA segregation ATPase FtsK/SpoIIIE|nr:DNA translocase FtsK [Candidatus Paceibacterota bacterium]